MKKQWFAMAMVLVLCMAVTAYQEQKIEKSFPADGKISRIDLANINGAITVFTQAADRFDIKAIKSSDRDGELEAVDILFETAGDQLKVRLDQKRKPNHVKVSFEVKVPRNVKQAVFQSVNGGITAKGSFSDLNLETVNGAIHCEGNFSESVLATVNGGVEVMVEEPLMGNLLVKTVNGGIDIELNRKSGFTLNGKTMNGGIDSDFNLSVDKGFVGSRIFGTVNDGLRKIELKTVNGAISISEI